MTTYTHLFNAPSHTWPSLVLRSVIELYNKVFPDRVRAVFELGSRTEGSAATISDIDAIIIFKEDFLSRAEMQLADDVLAQCQLISPFRLDVEVISESNLKGIDPCDVRISRGGTLIYGEDNRMDWWPTPSLDKYQDFMWRWSTMFVGAMHRSTTLPLPIEAPLPEDLYLGYTKVHRPAWYPAGTTHGTKELVATICWAATALLANVGVIVGSRAECLERLHTNVNDEWVHLVKTVYSKCKTQWDYEVPTDQNEQKELQALCIQALEFFNYFVKECPVQFRAEPT